MFRMISVVKSFTETYIIYQWRKLNLSYLTKIYIMFNLNINRSLIRMDVQK